MIVKLIEINAIPSETILMVGGFHTSVDESRNPSKMVLEIALDREKAGTDNYSFPLFLNAEGNYKTVPHMEMLNLFRAGAPFVPIICTDLQIFCSQSDGNKRYFATASKFEVVDFSKVEDIL